ncbi:molybdopterin-dependent oxidoreductase [Actinomadura flavalba]|uniref:molybdopterin-dependent oxidoreductase n=1 Tax=Actinomadura flavalba TaxID=1120938 RepID=UPI0003723AAB|nr:molybdopterin-dependent oxidoreductase [Actinomadura flavalba]
MSPLHDERLAAWLGVALGASLGAVFLTGLVSHFMQNAPAWAAWPSRPVNLYRVTQGVHVIGGLAIIPLLLAKLWTVYPRLFRWPPFLGAGDAVERAVVGLLVPAALFQVVTGLFNIAYWYPFPFFFTVAHYWTAWILAGAVLVHALNQRRKVAHAMMTKPDDAVPRRRFLLAVGATSGVVVLTTVGETLRPLARLALLAPRLPRTGPQELPVNRSAYAAGTTALANDDGWRLRVTGRVARPLVLSRADLRALPQRTERLPIACVEGWSASATWTGVRVRDLLDLAGAAPDARVRVESLERTGVYRRSWLDAPHARDPLTLLALGVNGAPLDADHGAPLRLVAPNRPGVMQTKWVGELVVT